MSVDHYIYKMRRPTDEELEFTHKRFVHESPLFIIEDNDEETLKQLSEAGLVRTTHTYAQNTDWDLIRTHNDIPKDVDYNSLSMRPEFVRLGFKTKDGYSTEVIISNWDWDHIYTVIENVTVNVVHAEKVLWKNNEPELTKLVRNWFDPRTISYGIMPKDMLETMYNEDWLDFEPKNDATYVYHEWY